MNQDELTLKRGGKDFLPEKRLKTIQLKRITNEVWKQDAVLTALDMEWLLQTSPAMLRGILEAYFENFAIFLPTAGTCWIGDALLLTGRLWHNWPLRA